MSYSPKINKLILLFLLAAVLRLFFVFGYPQIPVESDALDYDRLGSSLAQGKGFITEEGDLEMGRSPGFPFFLAVIYKIFGHTYKHVKFFQILISLITLGIIFCLARDVFGERVGFIAMFVGAIYPPFLSYNGLILSECLFTFCIVLFVYLSLLSIRRRDWLASFLAGLVGGFAFFVRQEFILFLPSLFILGYIYFKEDLKKIVLLILVALVIITPWIIRNSKAFDKFVCIPSQVSGIFWISTYEEEWLEWHSEDPYFRNLTKGSAGFEKDNLLLRESIKNIKEHPFLYTKFCFKRLVRFWIGSHSNTFYGLQESFTNYVSNKDYLRVAIKTSLLIFNTLLTFFGFCGIIMAIRKIRERRKEVVLLVMPISVIMIIHFFLFATLRYQVPIMPLMIIFASYIIASFWDQKQKNIAF
ncbi:ArnT family glycosyltransferase [Candidatus Omnitrophota bacterium]